MAFVEVAVRTDCTWSYIWDTSTIGKLLRPGTYTLYAIEGPFSPDTLEEKVFGTVSIIIKKPFVSCTVSHPKIAQGDRIIFSGVAEGILRQKIQIWIFSNSFFHQEIIQTNSDSSFAYRLSRSQTKQLKPDQYYVVIQHPMMNNEFDVYIDDLKKSVLSNFPKAATPLFSIEGSGSLHGAVAAMAVVDAINNPKIDDTATTCQFIVEIPVINIIPIGKKYTGESFSITASTNLVVDSEILIEVYSSSYDPDKKSQFGEPSGVTGLVKVIKGVLGYNQFSFNIDSSTFVPGEYNVKASTLNSDLTASATFIIYKPSIIPFLKNMFYRFFRK